MLFNQLELQPFIQKALDEAHFKELTPVQEQVIPEVLQGHNLIVQSKTGSGKTHSFMIPILQQIDPQRHEVQAVITAPSRELAEQLYEVAMELVEYSDPAITVVNYVGGSDKYRQIERLEQSGQPQLVIGTPGRIFDLMSEHALWVQTGTMMVIDEADMTLDLGFLPIVDEIASRMEEQLQFMVFSATIPQEIEVFVNKYVTAPQTIVIESETIIAEEITNYLISTRGRDRKALIYQLLTLGHPYLALVFANTKEYADQLSQYLKEQGLKVATIHGDISPRERRRTMRQIKNLEYQYVVATDLAARGIDIPGTSMVINAELPYELEFFIHRVGRTGRNQIEGVAYTLVEPHDDREISRLEAIGIEFIEVDLIDGEIKEVSQRYRRSQRQDTKKDLDDPVISAMVGRAKKQKVKPGYKRKLNQKIQKHKKTEARKRWQAERRQEKKKKKS